jgi:hypothetical protein
MEIKVEEKGSVSAFSWVIKSRVDITRPSEENLEFIQSASDASSAISLGSEM